MNPALRLAEIVTALVQVGLTVLVMGGHAVRYYGLDRNTIDYDLHLSPGDWDDLGPRLDRSTLAGGPLTRGPSWAPARSSASFSGSYPTGGTSGWSSGGTIICCRRSRTSTAGARRARTAAGSSPSWPCPT